jgi:hypothetical protein
MERWVQMVAHRLERRHPVDQAGTATAGAADEANTSSGLIGARVH